MRVERPRFRWLPYSYRTPFSQGRERIPHGTLCDEREYWGGGEDEAVGEVGKAGEGSLTARHSETGLQEVSAKGTR
jgi:hypothetical protein